MIKTVDHIAAGTGYVDVSRGAPKMRILHVLATTKRRGAELFASDLIRALNTDGISQRVAAIRVTPAEVPFPAPGSALDARELRFPGQLDPRALWRLRQLASAWRPDLVQAHGGEALKYAASSLVGTRTPMIYRRIGASPRWLAHGPRKSAYGWLMRRTARVVTVADEIRRETLRLFRVPAANIVTIPNGVDLRRLVPRRGRAEVRRSLGIPHGRPVIVSLGGITWEKDPLRHLRVTEQVLHEREVSHIWLGDGPMRGELERTGRELGLDGRLLVLGSRTDIGDLLGAADLMLFASRTDGMEGMPAAVIEAGLAGLPVVGYAVAGVPEVVVDAETGFLVDPGDEEGLAARVLDLLGDEVRRRAMGRAALERCMARFEIGAIAPRYLSLYEEVASE